ncbi:MAG: hypothetical protein HYS98_08195 [Deltaproteobacteria bacterium]|nr:hypothetical protein [Deltaproteobacteria bacterium]
MILDRQFKRNLFYACAVLVFFACEVFAVPVGSVCKRYLIHYPNLAPIPSSFSCDSGLVCNVGHTLSQSGGQHGLERPYSTTLGRRLRPIDTIYLSEGFCTMNNHLCIVSEGQDGVPPGTRQTVAGREWECKITNNEGYNNSQMGLAAITQPVGWAWAQPRQWGERCNAAVECPIPEIENCYQPTFWNYYLTSGSPVAYEPSVCVRRINTDGSAGGVCPIEGSSVPSGGLPNGAPYVHTVISGSNYITTTYTCRGSQNYSSQVTGHNGRPVQFHGVQFGDYTTSSVPTVSQQPPSAQSAMQCTALATIRNQYIQKRDLKKRQLDDVLRKTHHYSQQLSGVQIGQRSQILQTIYQLKNEARNLKSEINNITSQINLVDQQRQQLNCP